MNPCGVCFWHQKLKIASSCVTPNAQHLVLAGCPAWEGKQEGAGHSGLCSSPGCSPQCGKPLYTCGQHPGQLSISILSTLPPLLAALGTCTTPHHTGCHIAALLTSSYKHADETIDALLKSAFTITNLKQPLHMQYEILSTHLSGTYDVGL